MKIHSLWDAGPDFADRYSLFFKGKYDDSQPTLRCCLGFNEAPWHPQGFWQHTCGIPGKHNGKRITLDDLPEKLRDFVIKHGGIT